MEEGGEILVENRQLDQLYHGGDGEPHGDGHPVGRQPVLQYPVVKQSADLVVILLLIFSNHDPRFPGLLCHDTRSGYSIFATLCTVRGGSKRQLS